MTAYREYTSTIQNNSDTGSTATSTDPAYNRATFALCRVQCPATMTTATANIQVSEDGSRWDDLYDTSGTKLTFTAVQATSVALNPANYSLMPPYIRVKLAANNASGSAIAFKVFARAV